jgi:hypothetical protein
MPPKKKIGKELLAEGSSQVAGDQLLTTAQTTIQSTHISQIAHPQPSVEPRPTTTETRRLKDPVEQPATQAEVLTMNTSGPNTQPHTNSKKPKFKRTNNKIRKKRSNQSSKMSWHASARRMSTCDTCKST